MGRKREYPGKNHLTHPQVELDLSHLWPVWGSNPHQSQRWDDRMVKGDNESATLTTRPRGGAAEGSFKQIKMAGVKWFAESKNHMQTNYRKEPSRFQLSIHHGSLAQIKEIKAGKIISRMLIALHKVVNLYLSNVNFPKHILVNIRHGNRINKYHSFLKSNKAKAVHFRATVDVWTVCKGGGGGVDKAGVITKERSYEQNFFAKVVCHIIYLNNSTWKISDRQTNTLVLNNSINWYKGV